MHQKLTWKFDMLTCYWVIIDLRPELRKKYITSLRTRTMDAQWSLFSSKSFGLWQTIWADKFWGIFGRFISTHFGTVSPLSINLFMTSEPPKYPNSNPPNLLLWFFCLIKSKGNHSGITQPFLNPSISWASNCL